MVAWRSCRSSRSSSPACNDNEVGSASGLLNAVQQLGGTIGVAVSGTLFFQLLPTRGPVSAMQLTTLVAAGFLLVCLSLVRLLPKRARPE